MHENDKSKSINIAIENQPAFTPLIIKHIEKHNISFEKIVNRTNIKSIFTWLFALIKQKATISHYLMGYYYWFFYIIPKILGKTVILHWIGTDVYRMTMLKKNHKLWWKIRVWLLNRLDKHLVVSHALADELELAGIKADVVPLIPNLKKDYKITFPKKHKIFVYLPEHRVKFYGGDIVFKLAKEFNYIEFLITKHSGKDAPQLSNIKYFSWVDDIETIWNEITIYLRITEHDGLSHTILEALNRGKHVIWSQKFPHCYHATNYEEAKTALQQALQQTTINQAGIDFIEKEYNVEKLTQNFVDLYGSMNRK